MSKKSDPPIDLVTAIGRLLSDHTLRECFERSPDTLVRQLNILEQDRQPFLTMDIAEINAQAETLIRKRWHEVKRLIPETIAALGVEGFEVFHFFATNDWPEGYRRHPMDALQFMYFLEANRVQKPCKAERHRMRRLVHRK